MLKTTVIILIFFKIDSVPVTEAAVTDAMMVSVPDSGYSTEGSVVYDTITISVPEIKY